MSDEQELEHAAAVADGAIPATARPRDRADDRRDRDFEEFYRDFTPRLVRFLLWHGAELHLAADVAQETMRRAYRGWGRITQPGAWARTVAGRELTRRLVEQEHEALCDQVPERPVLLTESAGLSEERNQVLTLLRRLPPRQRQVMAWTYDGYTPQEIARILQISDDAVRSNLYKARTALATSLREQGVTRD
jgi:RNA polymerase sigma factor (sigma-70 family)